MWYFYVAAAVISALIYYLNFVPMHIKVKPPKNKRSAINQARRLKKPGDNIPPPFPNGWFAIATSDEIKPGTAKNIDYLGENFVVFRSATSKEIFVLDAYCPHMGANLGFGGIVNGDSCIRCPFHHWNFNGKDGSLVEIPYSEDIKSMEKFVKIKKWTSQEVNRIIFVWYHAENEDPWEIPHISEIENGEFWLHGSNEFTIHSHIRDVSENAADIAHFKALHTPNIFAGTDIQKISESRLCSHVWDAKWTVNENMKHMSKLKLYHRIQLWNMKLFQMNADIDQMGPGWIIIKLKTFFGNVLMFQTVTPIEPHKQKLSHYFYGTHFWGLLMKVIIFGTTVNVARDAMVWDNKTFFRNPILPKEEKQIKQYKTWYSQFYSQNSKTYQSANNDLSW